MGYINVNDCRARIRDDFEQLYELPEEQGDLERDIADAEALVNGYVGKRYETPITDDKALTLIKAWSLDLFAELAYQRTAGGSLPEKIKHRADEARKALVKVSEGKLTLAGATSVAAPSGSGVASVSGPDAQFTEKKMGGF